MDTALSEEQDAIRRTVRAQLAHRCGPDEVRSATRTGPGYDTALWQALAQRPGLPGLMLPERYGGAGRGATELALALQETGRALLPSPLLATAVLAAPLIDGLGSDTQRARLLPRLASGELTAAFAVPSGSLPVALGLLDPPPAHLPQAAGGSGDWAGGGRAGGVQAVRDGGEWRLYGECAQVLDGHSAGLLLVAAHAGGFVRSRTLLFLVDGDAPGLVRRRQEALDETRPLARLEMRDVAAELLGADTAGKGGDPADPGDPGDTVGGEDVRGALACAGHRVAAVLAAEAVGAAEGALDRAVRRVGSGERGDGPAGASAAVRHRLAEVHVQVRAARSAAHHAAWAVDAGTAEAGAASGTALAHGLEVLRLAAGEAVQLHEEGGVGEEDAAQLYFGRAAGSEALFGPVHGLRSRAAGVAGLFTGSAGEENATAAEENGGRGAAGGGGGPRAPRGTPAAR
ncbi:acyl-CoA dehydrogenase family protein [Streptomyces cacaoi]